VVIAAWAVQTATGTAGFYAIGGALANQVVGAVIAGAFLIASVVLQVAMTSRMNREAREAKDLALVNRRLIDHAFDQLPIERPAVRRDDA
jgi:hypothetical protein